VFAEVEVFSGAVRKAAVQTAWPVAACKRYAGRAFGERGMKDPRSAVDYRKTRVIRPHRRPPTGKQKCFGG